MMRIKVKKSFISSQQYMRLNVFCICFILILSTSASMTMIGFNTETKITSINLKCLQDRGYLEETFIQFYNDGDINMSVDYALLKQFSIIPHAVIFITAIDSLNPDWASTKFTQHILTHDYKKLWISWTMDGGYKVDCQGIWKILMSLRKITAVQIGIFMSEDRWNDNEYLNPSYCKVLNQLTLFAQDEKEFIPFEGWTNYSLKVKKIQKGICEIDQIEQIESKKVLQEQFI